MSIKNMVICGCLLLSGCSVLQSKNTFPSPPMEHMEVSEGPILLNRDFQLSDLVDTTKENNLRAFKNKSKLDGLQNWIKEQQKIYGSK